MNEDLTKIIKFMFPVVKAPVESFIEAEKKPKIKKERKTWHPDSTLVAANMP